MMGDSSKPLIKIIPVPSDRDAIMVNGQGQQGVNWQQEIVTIGKDVVHIKTKVDNIDKRVDSIDTHTTTRLNDHAVRIRTVEQKQSEAEGEEKAKERFYHKHPIKTAVIGGGGGGMTLLGIILGILRLTGVL